MLPSSDKNNHQQSSNPTGAIYESHRPDVDPKGKYIVVFGANTREGFYTASELLKNNWVVVGVTDNLLCPNMKSLVELGVMPFSAEPNQPLTAFPITYPAFGMFVDVQWGAYLAGAHAESEAEAARIRNQSSFLLTPSTSHKRIVYCLPRSEMAHDPDRFQARKALLDNLSTTANLITPLFLGYPYSDMMDDVRIDHAGTLHYFDPYQWNVRFPCYAVEQIGRWAAVAFTRSISKRQARRGMYVVRDNINFHEDLGTIVKPARSSFTLSTNPEELQDNNTRMLECRFNRTLGHLQPSAVCFGVQSSVKIVPDAWTLVEWVEQQEGLIWLRDQLRQNRELFTSNQGLTPLSGASYQTPHKDVSVQEHFDHEQQTPSPTEGRK